MCRFTPDEELKQAKWYKALASRLERNHSSTLAERFSILGVLSEQKAMILREIDEIWANDSDDAHEARVHRDFLSWSAGHFEAKHRKSKHH